MHAQSNYAAPHYTFTTLAGLAPSIGSNDGTGDAAQFSSPSGIAMDGSGNVFVADLANHTIRKITPGGVVTTFAGLAGSAGFQDGTGSTARFVRPGAIALDGSGNVYVTTHSMIRKITPAGVVTTLAGAGMNGASDGTGADARFYFPAGLAADGPGNVYVADTANHTIRKITAAGVVTTFAGLAGETGSADGTGSAARFLHPTGVAVDTSGNVYVTDSGNYTVRKITPAGLVTTLAGSPGSDGASDGTGANARFKFANGVAVDSSGNVYVAETGNSTIRMITPAGVVTTLAGSANAEGSLDGTGNAARFHYPNSLTVDVLGNIYVADTSNHSVRKVTPAGVVTTLAGRVGSMGSADGPGSNARFRQPTGVAVDAAGNTYVTDYENSTIRKITAAGVVTTFAGSVGSLDYVDGTGSSARFYLPVGIAVDNSGNLFVTEAGNSVIRKITAAGVVTTFAGSPGNYGSADGTGAAAQFSFLCMGVAADGSGNVYVADTYNHTIRKITSAGVVTTFAGAAGISGTVDGPAATARFAYPAGVAVDSAGNVYVTDGNNYTIRKITAAGIVSTLAGSAGSYGSADGLGSTARFTNPTSLALDSTGNVYVTDKSNQTIRKITPSGRVTTLGGMAGGLVGAADGTADAARFNEPWGIAVDTLGNLYIADSASNTIRKGTLATLASADFNADGQTDILWQNTETGQRQIWFMNGATATDAASLGTIDPGWSIAAAADFNGDRQADIVWQNTTTGERLLWFMHGATVTDTASLGTIDPAWSIAAAADFNADGKPDILWQNSTTGQRQIWFMNGATATNAVSLGTIDPAWSIAAAADFNGDGHPDILWQNSTTGQRQIWFMNGATATNAASLGIVDPAWSIAAAADFNADGKPDILWQNTETGQRQIWFMNGTTAIDAASLGTIDPAWSIAGPPTNHVPSPTPDFNADRHADILWQNTTTGERLLWFMHGATAIDAASLGTIDPIWSIAAAADFNGDRQADIVWQNATTGERLLWFMHGATAIDAVSLGTIDPAWAIAAAADFNGDRQADIVWQNATTGQRQIWFMHGATAIDAVSLGTIDPAWSIAAAADFNGDRQADIVWQNASTGERQIWLMNGATAVDAISLGTIDPGWSIAN